MAMRNRVTPLGEIIATGLRGSWLGNRGILHVDHSIVRFHASDLWIICALSHRGWRLPQWQPGHFTVLFFHDEAVALAAGHRPCALCRRSAYDDYRRAWARALGETVPLAREIDRRLHGERIVRGTHERRLHEMSWRDLPRGTFVQAADGPVLVLDEQIVPWSPSGYGPAGSRPLSGRASVITPPSSVAALRAGFEAQIAPEALAAA